ncbi:MAG: hypothetical protein M1817_006227 [Caeruleum heppii]|nr:MAG: hypothetical protein M1817_006227 [Caeruleum heppii]
MTQISSSVNTHPGPQLGSVTSFLPSPAHASNGTLPPAAATVEDDSSTIKCFCDFNDDDGHTVLCEGCDTWQHVECYYPTHKVAADAVHNCIDCEPRAVDPKRATERQRRLREQLDPSLRKAKRPPTKSHKKKPKDLHQGALQTNGLSGHDRQDGQPAGDRHSGSPKDQPPPAKRPKTSHRSSSSITSQAEHKNARLWTPDTHKRSDSQPYVGRSLTTSPSLANQRQPQNGYHNCRFSAEFMDLYRKDPGDQKLQANLLSNINFTTTFSSWIHDSEALREATDGKSPGEVFQRVDQPFDELELPKVIKKFKEDETITCHGQHPQWKYATVESFVPDGGLVGELKGEIGHLRDYWQNPNNRPSLRHPEPFVFFHPQLPIYIDTRTEGTTCRYVRRSCRPNVMMRTLISDGHEYHFCLCATENLEPGTEITIAWDPDPETSSLLNRELAENGSADVKAEGLSQGEYDYTAGWVETVLANFGGCACNSPRDCALAQFDRRKDSATPDLGLQPPNGTKSKTSRKTKSHNLPSGPEHTSHASNGRSGSEGLGLRDHDDDHDDSRSTTGSLRSKPRSRDMTPATHLSSDTTSAPLVPEMSDREKRKIAALEKTFEQLENDTQHQVQRKKKRSSGGSMVPTPGAPASVSSREASRLPRTADFQKQSSATAHFQSQPTTPSIHPRANYTNASTSRRQSNSPTTDPRADPNSELSSPTGVMMASQPMTPPLPSVRPTSYKDLSVQTDIEEDPWYHRPSPNRSRKSFVPLTKRLLMRCHEDKIRLEEETRRKEEMVLSIKSEEGLRATLSVDAAVTGPVEHLRLESEPAKASEDVEMTDASVKSENQSESNAAPGMTPLDPNVQKPGPPALSTTNHVLENAPSAPIKPPPPPWTSSATPVSPDGQPVPNGRPATELRVQLPPAPQFSNTSPSSPSVPGTPSSAAGSIAQSPFGLTHIATSFSPTVMTTVVQPSPVKKKLSLSDYSRRKKAEIPSTTTTGEKTGSDHSPTMTPHPPLKPTSSLAEEIKVPEGSGALEGSAIVDSPPSTAGTAKEVEDVAVATPSPSEVLQTG